MLHRSSASRLRSNLLGGLGALVLLANATWRCSPTEDVGRSSAAVADGHQDFDDPVRNASVLLAPDDTAPAVGIGLCGGTLVVHRQS